MKLLPLSNIVLRNRQQLEQSAVTLNNFNVRVDSDNELGAALAFQVQVEAASISRKLTKAE